MPAPNAFRLHGADKGEDRAHQQVGDRHDPRQPTLTPPGHCPCPRRASSLVRQGSAAGKARSRLAARNARRLGGAPPSGQDGFFDAARTLYTAGGPNSFVSSWGNHDYPVGASSMTPPRPRKARFRRVPSAPKEASRHQRAGGWVPSSPRPRRAAARATPDRCRPPGSRSTNSPFRLLEKGSAARTADFWPQIPSGETGPGRPLRDVVDAVMPPT